jgi:hypothetical protein
MQSTVMVVSKGMYKALQDREFERSEFMKEIYAAMNQQLEDACTLSLGIVKIKNSGKTECVKNSDFFNGSIV